MLDTLLFFYPLFSIVAVICVVAGLFFIYDLLVRREIRALQAQTERYKKKFGEIVQRRNSTLNVDLRSKEAVEILFSKLDKDGNGTVDKEELKLYVGDAIEEKDFEAMWANIDLDKNGSLEFGEFSHFLAEVGLASTA